MGISLTQQTTTFLISCFIGVLFGAFYDIFRISRIAFKQPVWLLFIEDLIFFLICSAATFSFMLYKNMGEVRWFILFGEFLGAVFYYFTLGDVIISLAGKIIQVIKIILHRIYRWVLRPIIKLLRKIIRILGMPIDFCCNIIKKVYIIGKINLKRQSVLLYNLFNLKNVFTVKTKKVK